MWCGVEQRSLPGNLRLNLMGIGNSNGFLIPNSEFIEVRSQASLVSTCYSLNTCQCFSMVQSTAL